MPAPVDALFLGTVFLDIVLAELDASPAPGQEVWASRRALSPGGMANNAVGAARLGMRTALVTAIGDDACGRLVWDALDAEPGLDLAWARRVAGLETPVTVALSDSGDRSFISHGILDPLPVADIAPELPAASTCFASLHPEPVDWFVEQRRAGSVVFAGVGWDEREGWSHQVLAQLADVDVFVANEREALAYSGASTAQDALRRLGERVPLVVVSRGEHGAIALDSATGEEVGVPAVAGPVRDTTGAGDEFVAGLMHATLGDLPLADRLRYAALCSGLSVRGWGGAASAPTAADLATWSRSSEPRPDGYGFLDTFLADRSLATGALSPSI